MVLQPFSIPQIRFLVHHRRVVRFRILHSVFRIPNSDFRIQLYHPRLDEYQCPQPHVDRRQWLQPPSPGSNNYMQCLLPYAPCSMPYACRPLPHALRTMRPALCPMLSALCSMPHALCALILADRLFKPGHRIFDGIVTNAKGNAKIARAVKTAARHHQYALFL